VKIDNLEIKAKKALYECLNNISSLNILETEVKPNYGDTQPDYYITLQFQGKLWTIIAEIKNNGEPRYARQAANQIRRYYSEIQNNYWVFIAPYISLQAAKICEREGIGYLDLAGNCHISFATLYVHIEGRPNPFTRNRYLRSLFSPKAERILRVLLTTGPKEWKMEELASEADVSLGQVSNVKKLLADQDWIDSKTVGFSLSDPLSLLEEWSQNYKYRRNKVENFYTLLSAAEFEYKLAEVCQIKQLRYGLTGFSGSARYAPAVRYQQVMAYVQNDIDQLAEYLDVKPVDSGPNVLLLRPYDEGVFYGAENKDGTIVVSPIQIYLDLSGIRGRGEEAAEILLDRVIRSTW